MKASRITAEQIIAVLKEKGEHGGRDLPEARHLRLDTLLREGEIRRVRK
jgi:hypothetical protein